MFRSSRIWVEPDPRALYIRIRLDLASGPSFVGQSDPLRTWILEVWTGQMSPKGARDFKSSGIPLGYRSWENDPSRPQKLCSKTPLDSPSAMLGVLRMSPKADLGVLFCFKTKSEKDV